jgi:hypothetical protein
MVGEGGAVGRMDLHPVPVLQPLVEIRVTAVDMERRHFGVGNTEGLDHVLGGRAVRARHGKFHAATVRGEKIIQLVMETECGGGHGPLWQARVPGGGVLTETFHDRT